MKITWLGQAGFLFETEDMKILVDPYLSDSAAKINPANRRRVPPDESFFALKPDVIVLTHNHIDHTDPDTLKRYLGEKTGVTVLASKNAWIEARKFGGNNNYVMFNEKTVWSHKNLRFEAVYAEHSDDYAIGVIIYDGKKTYYITGDTLYNEKIFADLPQSIDWLFLPVNGAGNNMNFRDAERFAKRVGAKSTVPMHFGLFDSLNPSNFICDNRVIPVIYKEIEEGAVIK